MYLVNIKKIVYSQTNASFLYFVDIKLYDKNIKCYIYGNLL